MRFYVWSFKPESSACCLAGDYREWPKSAPLRGRPLTTMTSNALWSSVAVCSVACWNSPGRWTFGAWFTPWEDHMNDLRRQMEAL